MKIDGILSLVGNTPMVRLNRIFDDIKFELYAKLELLNPAGSIKDRPALKMIQAAFENGDINPNTTIIESSSGNMAVALSQICTYLDLKLICVVDIGSTEANRQIMQGYGAKVDLITEPHPEEGFLGARLRRVQELLETIPNSFNCDQYNNVNHTISHHSTIQEIITDLGVEPDYLFCATSTCGSLKGCSNYIEKHKLKTKMIAIDAFGSVIFGDQPKPRRIPGHGASIIPPFYTDGLEHEHILISDMEAIIGCKKLMRREGIFAGGSSGAIMSGIGKYISEIPENSKCVAILYDRGGRYHDTIYSDKWIKENFSDEYHLLEEELTPLPILVN